MNSAVIIIVRWLIVALGIALATTLFGLYLIDKMVPKVYTSQTSIRLLPPGHRPPPKQTEPEPFQTELEYVQSPPVLAQAINDLDLKKKWARQTFPASSTMSDADALHYLQDHLKIDFQSQGTVLTIAVVSTDPQEAADIANAIAGRYQIHRAAQSLYLEQLTYAKKTGADIHSFLKMTAARVDQIHADMGKMNPADPRYNALQDEYRRQLQQLTELQSIDQSAPPSAPLDGTMVILSRAEPASVSAEPNQSLYFIIILLTGLSLGMGLATFLEMGFWFRRIA